MSRFGTVSSLHRYVTKVVQCGYVSDGAVSSFQPLPSLCSIPLQFVHAVSNTGQIPRDSTYMVIQPRTGDTSTMRTRTRFTYKLIDSTRFLLPDPISLMNCVERTCSKTYLSVTLYRKCFHQHKLNSDDPRVCARSCISAQRNSPSELLCHLYHSDLAQLVST